MDKIAKLYADGFKPSKKVTPEFESFARKFKTEFKKELETIGAELTKFIIGYYNLSGFFRVDGKCYYFSLPDVRNKLTNGELVYRTTKNENSYSGGMNKFILIKKGMAKRMKF